MNQRLRWGQIGKGKTEAERVRLRRKKLESLLGKKLTSIGSFCLDPEKIKGRNLENMIGVTQVPLGVAGPLIMQKAKSKKQNYFVPLATTEGALIASINRGCKVIEQAGGCQVMVEEKGTTRGPVFRVDGIVEGQKLRQWLDKNLKRLQQVAKETDKHTKLLWLESRQTGRNVFVRFGFNTAEAMGMNMVTVATDRMVKLVEKKLKIECVSLSGNYCVDKKPSWLNFISGRGKQVWAEVVVPEKVVRQVLKTTAKKVTEVVYRKQLLGSVMSGSIGFNDGSSDIFGDWPGYGSCGGR